MSLFSQVSDFMERATQSLRSPKRPKLGGLGQPSGKIENWPRKEPLDPFVHKRRKGERPKGYPRSLPWNEANSHKKDKTMGLFDKISDFMSTSRKKSKPKKRRTRRTGKRTVKVCYCEKKYLARDGARRTKRYKCACKDSLKLKRVPSGRSAAAGWYFEGPAGGMIGPFKTKAAAKDAHSRRYGPKSWTVVNPRRGDGAHSKKKWMQKATKKSHRGALHKTLGIPVGERIPYKLKDEGCKHPRKTLARVTGRTPSAKASRKFQKQACLARTYAKRGKRKDSDRSSTGGQYTARTMQKATTRELMKYGWDETTASTMAYGELASSGLLSRLSPREAAEIIDTRACRTAKERRCK